MRYSIKTPNERIYNVVADPEQGSKSQLFLKPTSSATHIDGNFLGDSGRFFDFEIWENFSYASQKLDLNDVSGSFTRFTYSY